MIFESVPESTGRGGGVRGGENEIQSKPGSGSVVLVPSLGRGKTGVVRRLSTGDLGLVMNILMRRLWQVLDHGPAAGPARKGS